MLIQVNFRTRTYFSPSKGHTVHLPKGDTVHPALPKLNALKLALEARKAQLERTKQIAADLKHGRNQDERW